MLRHAAVRTLVRLSGWTFGYVVANQVALWVVLVLANGVHGGAFAYLSAYAFFQLPHGLFSVSIMTAVGQVPITSCDASSTASSSTGWQGALLTEAMRRVAQVKRWVSAQSASTHPTKTSAYAF